MKHRVCALISLTLLVGCSSPPKNDQDIPNPVAESLLRGRVMRDGRPAVGTVAALYPPPPEMPGMHVSMTRALAIAVADDDGWFTFASPIPAGEYELRLEDHRPPVLAGSQPAYIARNKLTVLEGQPSPPLHFVLR